jgi:rhodanese-related sulfurtransferase
MTFRLDHRWLAVIAAVLGGMAAFAGSPYWSRHASIDVDELARSVAREDDHVTAVELARWIHDRKRGLQVIDLRAAGEYETYHVPTARRVALESLSHTVFPSDATLVICSGGGAHAAQAWVFLRALGYPRVYFLRGGVQEWIADVLNPSLPMNPSPHDAAEFARIAALSRYFGGVPRADVSTPTTPSHSDPDSSLPGKGDAAIGRSGC